MTTAISVPEQTTTNGSSEPATDTARDLIFFLQRRAFRLAGSESDAWDLVQDALERTLRRWPGTWANEDARKWLAVVLRNLHIDRLRSAAWRASRTRVPDGVERLASPDACELPLWRTIDPERVRAGLAQLQEEHRRMLLMQVEGKSLREIGEAVGSNPATVGTQLFRAKKQLRAILGRSPASQESRDPRPSAVDSSR
jgi:RNA polymerase sigma factor (sigma-70 family)